MGVLRNDVFTSKHLNHETMAILSSGPRLSLMRSNNASQALAKLDITCERVKHATSTLCKTCSDARRRYRIWCAPTERRVCALLCACVGYARPAVAATGDLGDIIAWLCVRAPLWDVARACALLPGH